MLSASRCTSSLQDLARIAIRWTLTSIRSQSSTRKSVRIWPKSCIEPCPKRRHNASIHLWTCAQHWSRSANQLFGCPFRRTLDPRLVCGLGKPQPRAEAQSDGHSNAAESESKVERLEAPPVAAPARPPRRKFRTLVALACLAVVVLTATTAGALAFGRGDDGPEPTPSPLALPTVGSLPTVQPTPVTVAQSTAVPTAPARSNVQPDAQRGRRMASNAHASRCRLADRLADVDRNSRQLPAAIPRSAGCDRQAVRRARRIRRGIDRIRKHERRHCPPRTGAGTRTRSPGSPGCSARTHPYCCITRNSPAGAAADVDDGTLSNRGSQRDRNSRVGACNRTTVGKSRPFSDAGARNRSDSRRWGVIDAPTPLRPSLRHQLPRSSQRV